MININKLYEAFNSEYNTSQLGYVRPATDFVPKVNSISLEIFTKLVGLAPKNTKIQDWLSPFLVTKNVSVQSSGTYDFIVPPRNVGYEHFAGARVLMEDNKFCGEKCDLIEAEGSCVPFEELREDFFTQTPDFKEEIVPLLPVNKRAAITKHATKKPSIQKRRIYITPRDNNFEVLPRGVGIVVLDFYRKPKDAVYNYDARVEYPDEYMEFKEEGSVHLEWSETLIPVFLYELGKWYGLRIQDQLMLQVRQVDKIFEI